MRTFLRLLLILPVLFVFVPILAWGWAVALLGEVGDWVYDWATEALMITLQRIARWV